MPVALGIQESCQPVSGLLGGPFICYSVQPPSRTSSKPQSAGSQSGIYLGHFLPVGLGVQGCLGEQGWMLFRCNTKLIVERVVPDLGGRGKARPWDAAGARPSSGRDQSEHEKPGPNTSAQYVSTFSHMQRLRLKDYRELTWEFTPRKWMSENPNPGLRGGVG